MRVNHFEPPYDSAEGVSNIASKIQTKKLIEISSGVVEFYDTARPMPSINIGFNRFVVCSDDLEDLKNRLQSAFLPCVDDSARLRITFKTNSVFGLD